MLTLLIVFLFLPEFQKLKLGEITLDVPKSYQVYSAIGNQNSHHLKATNYHELFDSPFDFASQA